MQLRVGCEFAYDAAMPAPAVMLVEPHPDPEHTVVTERWETTPVLEHRTYLDGYNNRCRRLTLPQGPSTLRYDAVVETSGDPDPVSPGEPQAAVEDLPDETLIYTLASRYCPTETLSENAWRIFGGSPLGWGRVHAVCDWIHTNIRYGVPSTPQTTAVDVFVGGGGMCRDFAHLAITFCRALNIPARYVFGYISDIGDPGPPRPMDFHAWFEAYLGGRWWPFDARFNFPRIGRIPVGIGRDAVDVAMVTTYGPATFRSMVVWSDEVASEHGNIDHATGLAPNQDLRQGSEGLVVGRGEQTTTGEQGGT